ncbi:MAG: hypothetical protein ACI9WS_001681 [Paraglaciecola psychrophila]|jgi:hypothetical protein
MLAVIERIALSKPLLAEELLALLQSVQLERGQGVAELCEAMLSSGWYGETTCGEYIALCAKLSHSSELWLEVGSQCQQFLNNNRVTLAYLRSLGELTDGVEPARAQYCVDTINQLLAAMVNSSPALLVDVINTVCEVFPSELASSEQAAFPWLAAARRFSVEEPSNYQRFLTLSRELHRVLPVHTVDYWQWLIALADENVTVSLTVMQALPQFGELLENPVTLDFLRVIARDETATQTLIAGINRDWDSACLATILPFSVALAALDITAVVQLLISAKAQSLDLSKLQTWLERGLAVSQEQLLAGQAWFALESLASQHCYADVRGAVALSDCGPLLSMMAEGLGGASLAVSEIESLAWQPDYFSQQIQLPAEIALLSHRDDNFSLYRLMILYQVSLWESGAAAFLQRCDAGSAAEFVSNAENPTLAINLLNSYLPAYIEHYMSQRYPGIVADLRRWQAFYLAERCSSDTLAEHLLQQSLRQPSEQQRVQPLEQSWQQTPQQLSAFSAAALGSIEALMQALEKRYKQRSDKVQLETLAPVFYRGWIGIDIPMLLLRMTALKEEVENITGEDESEGLTDVIDPDNVNIEELREGETQNAMAQFLTDLEGKIAEGDIEDEGLKEKAQELREKLLLEHGLSKKEAQLFTYNEWDYLIGDYRKDWCILHQILLPSESEQFVRDTLEDNKDLLRQIRQQLQMLKPELHRKVRGLSDGEDIHHDDAIDAMIDLKSGISPNENIYIQRQRAERDVSTLFLLDMSASTDESIESLKKTAAQSQPVTGDKAKTGADAIDYLMDAYDSELKLPDANDDLRIIDIERQSVVLMAEALAELGDSYAIAGFSGYGREQVEYFMCKDFDEHYNSIVKGRIEAISPRRSTRMGPPIRHGIAQLKKTESKVKAMIIISDGYPQDFDYGKDRKSKQYGIEDTAKALREAKREGIHTFCLTVDPAGHDYLKEMCPDDQYMIIRDIEELPRELSRVYSSLTS